MKIPKMTRRDFIKATALSGTAVAATLVVKDAIDDKKTADLADLEVVEEAPAMTCLDLVKAMQQKS